MDMLLEVNMAGKDTAASPHVQLNINPEHYTEIIHQEEIMLSVCTCHVVYYTLYRLMVCEYYDFNV